MNIKVIAKYHDYSAKKSSGGVYGKLIIKNFRGKTYAKIYSARIKWEHEHPWMSYVSSTEVHEP